MSIQLAMFDMRLRNPVEIHQVCCVHSVRHGECVSAEAEEWT